MQDATTYVYNDKSCIYWLIGSVGLHRHTVEEFQNFFKSRGVSMPWVNVVRALVPLSLCDLAAALLIKACGGEEVMKQTLGGTKWWQVRDTQG